MPTSSPDQHKLPRSARYYTGWSLIAAAIFAALAAFILGQAQKVTLRFDVQSAGPGSLQFYYSRDGHFSEIRSAVVPAAPERPASAVIRIPADEARLLRIDPAPGVENVRLCNARYELPSGHVVPLFGSSVQRATQLVADFRGSCAELTADANAADPQLVVDHSPVRSLIESEEKIGRQRRISWALCAAAMLLFGFVVLRPVPQAMALDQATFAIGRWLPLIYAVIALVFGTLLLLATPPGAVPDEPAHTAKVILVENGEWLGMPASGAVNPTLSSVMGPFGDFLNPGKRFTVSDVFTHAGRPLSCRSDVEAIPESAVAYSPTLYLPPSYVLNLACRFGSTNGAFLYGGRFANLALAILLTALGLHLAGSGRWGLFSVALLPMTLAEQASLTADSSILGLTFCLVGLQAGLATGVMRAGLRAEVGLLVLGMALALSKPGYAWVAAGFIFSWNAYRRTGTSFTRGALLAIAIPWSVHVAWTLMSAGEATPRAGVDSNANLQAILQDPGAVLALLGRTFSADNTLLWTSLLGRLGWLDVVMQPASYALAIAALFVSLVMRDRNDAVDMPRWTRPLAVCLSLGGVLLPVIPMYLFWTPANAIHVEGLQGRYFLPVLAFFLCWGAFRSPPFIRASGALLLICVPILTNADAVSSIVARYYA